VLFDWETAGSVDGWAADWGPASAVAQTTAQREHGSGALTFQVAVTASGLEDLGVTHYYDPPQNLSAGSNRLTGWVYLPASAPTGVIANLALYDPSYTMVTSPNTALVPGAWTQVVWPNAPVSNVSGVTVTLGSTSVSYSGAVYVDYLVVQ
jgi:hypothetical protein